MKALLLELQNVLEMPSEEVHFHSNSFEDNTGAQELAASPKFRPRTKHIAIKYHHFSEHVRRKEIVINHVRSQDQLSEI